MANQKKPDQDARNQEESRRILERIEQESETVGTSSMRRVSSRINDHLTGDADPDNKIEVLGTRIGRSLGIIFFVGLLIYLVKTYVLHV